MANITETATFDANVYQIATSDPVLGGADGIANAQAKALANRTKFLKAHVDAIEDGSFVPSGMVSYIGAGVLRNKINVDKTGVTSSASGAVTLDLSTKSIFELTLTGDTTVGLSGIPALSGETLYFVVRVTQGSTAYLLNWFSTITWLTIGGTAPAAPAANKTIEYIFSSTTSGSFLGRKGAST
jgi:hypothetical protein